MWSQIELSFSKISLHSMICSQLPINSKYVSDSLVVTNTLKIWVHFRKHFGLIRLSALVPIVNSVSFLPSCSDPVFHDWSSRGFRIVKDLYDKDIFFSFSELSEKFNLPKTHLFSFFQIRHFVQKHFVSPQFFLNLPSD